MDESSFEAGGKTLAQAAPELYAEVIAQLQRRNMSDAACVLNDDEVEALLQRLQSAVIRDACACGQVDCKTYYFDVPEKPDKRDFHTVRLNVRGDLLVHIDSECDVFKVQRLYDLTGVESTRYIQKAGGHWERVEF